MVVGSSVWQGACARLLTGVVGGLTMIAVASASGVDGRDWRPAPARSDACVIEPRKELVITDLAVVDDRRARAWGPWAFGRLMADMAPPGVSGARFVESFFDVWIASAYRDTTDFFNIDGAANPSTAAARTRAESIAGFLESWPRQGNGALDLEQAPLRLAAIVNRVDVNEGRFVFVFVDEEGHSRDATIILEYELPAIGPDGSEQSPQWWAFQWHALAGLVIGTSRYLSHLEGLTRRFAARGMNPDSINGSAIRQIRVNEQLSDTSPGGVGLEIVPVWQLREFHLDPDTGLLAVAPVEGSPHIDYDTYHESEGHPEKNIERLVEYLLDNEEALLAGEFVYDPLAIEEGITAPLRGQAFSWLQEEPAPPGMDEGHWDALRRTFSGTTCNGCHGYDDGYWIEFPNPIDHAFTHISMREEGVEATISQHLKDDLMEVRIPNMLSHLCPDDPKAKRADPTLRPVH